jgi:hypothetical protein
MCTYKLDRVFWCCQDSKTRVCVIKKRMCITCKLYRVLLVLFCLGCCQDPTKRVCHKKTDVYRLQVVSSFFLVLPFSCVVENANLPGRRIYRVMCCCQDSERPRFLRGSPGAIHTIEAACGQGCVLPESIFCVSLF